MSARITERQCGINQKRGLYSCGKCEGLIKVAEVAMEEVIVGFVAVCKECKLEKEIISKGLCRKCYDALRQAKRNAARKASKESSECEPTFGALAVETPYDKLANDFADVIYDAVNRAAREIDTAPRSLLSLITPPLAVKTEGIFLDFSEHIDLLTDLQAISDDVPGDILELCSMLVSGKLRLVA